MNLHLSRRAWTSVHSITHAIPYVLHMHIWMNLHLHMCVWIEVYSIIVLSVKMSFIVTWDGALWIKITMTEWVLHIWSGCGHRTSHGCCSALSAYACMNEFTSSHEYMNRNTSVYGRINDCAPRPVFCEHMCAWMNVYVTESSLRYCHCSVNSVYTHAWMNAYIHDSICTTLLSLLRPFCIHTCVNECIHTWQYLHYVTVTVTTILYTHAWMNAYIHDRICTTLLSLFCTISTHAHMKEVTFVCACMDRCAPLFTCMHESMCTWQRITTFPNYLRIRLHVCMRASSASYMHTYISVCMCACVHRQLPHTRRHNGAHIVHTVSFCYTHTHTHTHERDKYRQLPLHTYGTSNRRQLPLHTHTYVISTHSFRYTHTHIRYKYQQLPLHTHIRYKYPQLPLHTHTHTHNCVISTVSLPSLTSIWTHAQQGQPLLGPHRLSGHLLHKHSFFRFPQYQTWVEGKAVKPP